MLMALPGPVLLMPPPDPALLMALSLVVSLVFNTVLMDKRC